MTTRLKELYAHFHERILGGPTTEGEQALLRVVIGFLLTIYVFYVNEPGYVQRQYLYYFAIYFGIYCIAVIYWLYKENGVVPLRYHLIVFIDVVNTTIALYLCRQYGMPIIFAYIWMNLGYAYRFGVKYMWMGALYSVASLGVLYVFFTRHWLNNVTIYFGISLMILTLALYLHLFLKREAKVKEALVKLTRENRELLDKNMVSMENASKRIAADLHDMLGQEFVALRNYAQLASSKLKTHTPENIKASTEYMREIVKIVTGLQDVIKDILKNIWPESLQELGLVVSIREFIYTQQKSNPAIKFQFTTNTEEPEFQGEKDIHIYRIVQEAITNIIKHANATEVNVSLDKKILQEIPLLVIEISDNGVGLNHVKNNQKKGFGMISMRERTNTLGGTLNIASTDEGTTIVISVPILITASGQKALG